MLLFLCDCQQGNDYSISLFKPSSLVNAPGLLVNHLIHTASESWRAWRMRSSEWKDHSTQSKYWIVLTCRELVSVCTLSRVQLLGAWQATIHAVAKSARSWLSNFMGGTSLVVQWLRICPLLQPFRRTQIQLKSKLAIIIGQLITLPFQRKRDQSCTNLLALTLTLGLCCF